MLEPRSYGAAPFQPARNEVETYILQMLEEMARLARVWRATEMETELTALCRRFDDGREH